MAAYEILLLNTAIPQIQAAQSGDTYVVPRDIAFSTVANLANGTNLLPSLTFSSDTNTGIYREGADALGFTAGGGTNQMVLTSTGLGIGTNNPGTKLAVNGTSAFGTGFASADISNSRPTYVRSSDNNSLISFQSSSTSGDGFMIGMAGAEPRLQVTNNLPLVFLTNNTERMRLDSSGNLGLGVTPSAWGSGFKAFEVGKAGSGFFSVGTDSLQVTNNYYYNGTNYIYAANGYAERYHMVTGQHIWFTAPSGTANTTTITNGVSYTIITSGNQTDFGAANNNVGTSFTANASGTLSSGTVSQNISFTQAMTLDASGNLGLGQTSIAAVGNYTVLNIRGRNNLNGGLIRLETLDGTSGVMRIYQGENDGNIEVLTNDPLIFSTNATERARITSGGDFLITTNTFPSGSVGGFGFSASQYAYFSRSGGETLNLDRFTSEGAVAKIRYAGTEVGSISVTASATAYNTSSDYRLKDNQQPLTGSGAFIDALKPKTWDWKSGGKGVGFIAHEVAEVSPNSVVGTKDAVDEEGKPIMQAMEYGSAEFIANIIAELQSLRARVAQLEQGA